MVRSLYTSASGLLVEDIRMSVTANNLANVDTNGYKKDEAVVKAFPNMLIRRLYDMYLKIGKIETGTRDGVVFKGQSSIRDVNSQPGPSLLQTLAPQYSPNPGHVSVEPSGLNLPKPDRIDLRPAIGYVSAGAIVDDVVTNFQQGSLRETGNPLDLALEGEGFFTIMSELGPRYTRDGNFTINSKRELVTEDGYQVMGQRGPITLADKNIYIDEQGNIYIQQVGPDGVTTYDRQNPYDKIRIVRFDDRQKELRKVGDNLYREEPASRGPIDVTDATLQQGYLENSNVNPVDMMVRLIEVYRSYEANQRSIIATDEMLGKAVNEVGRV